MHIDNPFPTGHYALILLAWRHLDTPASFVERRMHSKRSYMRINKPYVCIVCLSIAGRKFLFSPSLLGTTPCNGIMGPTSNQPLMFVSSHPSMHRHLPSRWWRTRWRLGCAQRGNPNVLVITVARLRITENCSRVYPTELSNTTDKNWGNIN